MTIEGLNDAQFSLSGALREQANTKLDLFMS